MVGIHGVQALVGMRQSKALEVLFKPRNVHQSIKVQGPIRHRHLRPSVDLYSIRIAALVGR